MDLKLKNTPEEDHDWYLRSEPELDKVDIMDMMFVHGFARRLWLKDEDLRPAIEEYVDQCTQEALELGMFMGCSNLCKKIGADFEDYKDLSMEAFGKAMPDLSSL